MSQSKLTRSRAFGLRIASPGCEEWHWFASDVAMSRDLALRLRFCIHGLGHGTGGGPEAPFTVVDADGTCITWVRETAYQATHTHHGATWRIRTERKTYEVFGRNGCPLQVTKVRDSIDLEEHLSWPKPGAIGHGDRGRGPVPRIHKSCGGSGWFRRIKTSQEIRLNALVLTEEGEVPVRAARTRANLPTAWDDLLREPQRSWKVQRKRHKQWARA